MDRFCLSTSQCYVDVTTGGVAQHYFAAVSHGDMETVAALLDPSVVWHQPGNNRFSGTHEGVAAIAQLVDGMMEVSEGTFTLTVTGPTMRNGDDVAVPVRFQGQRQGTPQGTLTMDMTGIDLLTVTNGKITAVRLFSEDQLGEDQFWGTP